VLFQLLTNFLVCFLGFCSYLQRRHAGPATPSASCTTTPTTDDNPDGNGTGHQRRQRQRQHLPHRCEQLLAGWIAGANDGKNEDDPDPDPAPVPTAATLRRMTTTTQGEGRRGPDEHENEHNGATGSNGKETTMMTSGQRWRLWAKMTTFVHVVWAPGTFFFVFSLFYPLTMFSSLGCKLLTTPTC
jgi:hypothetical protein